MHLFQFDEIGPELSLLPMAARRALDAVGKRIGREAFASLSLQLRRTLVELGGVEHISRGQVEELLAFAQPAAEECAVRVEPPAESVPEEIARVLGPTRPIPEKVWQNLDGLHRYALMKVCDKPREPRLTQAYEEIIGQSQVSSHLKPAGGVHMISVAKKEETLRRAQAESWVHMNAEAYLRLRQSTLPKGDVLATARIAGIMACKKTSDLIPLCHPLGLSHAEIDFAFDDEKNALRILCATSVTARTGVEMEAMTGASVAALSVYDMLKSIDREVSIGPTRLLLKTGGRSGDYRREESKP